MRYKDKVVIIIGLLLSCAVYTLLDSFNEYDSENTTTKNLNNSVQKYTKTTSKPKETPKQENLISEKEAQSVIRQIVTFIQRDLPYKIIAQTINSLELKSGKTIKELTVNNLDAYEVIMQKMYKENNYQTRFSKTYEPEVFEVNFETIFEKNYYSVDFYNETLIVKNFTKRTVKSVDLSNYVQGVTTPERIEIYSQLQKLDGCLLEFILDEVGGITSAIGSKYGGWFLKFGIATLHDFNALAHETGHAIDNYFSDEKYIHFSDEFTTNKTYHNEILSMYKAAEENEYYHSLIGNYEYKDVPRSEREVYAECVRTILGYSDEAHLNLYKKFLPNVLKYVASNMNYVRSLSDEARGSAHKKQKLNIPEGGNIKAARKRLEEGEYQTLYVNNKKFFE